MKVYEKVVIGVVLAVLGASLIVCFVPPVRDLAFRAFCLHAINRAQQRRARLLCETDHQALLDAGRQVLRQAPIESQTEDGRKPSGHLPVPKAVEIPKAIRRLKPHGLFVDYDGYVTMEMHGGMDHFGIRIYPADFNEPEPNFFYGHRKLVEGLWYYDDGYLHNPEYDKRIDAIIEEHRRP